MPALLFLAATREFTGFHGISALLLAAGIISLGAWLLAFGFRWLQTRPDLPDAGPEISEIPANPESPGVVNFLVNNWRATPSPSRSEQTAERSRRPCGAVFSDQKLVPHHRQSFPRRTVVLN